MLTSIDLHYHFSLYPKHTLFIAKMEGIWAMKHDRRLGNYYKAHCKHIYKEMEDNTC